MGLYKNPLKLQQKKNIEYFVDKLFREIEEYVYTFHSIELSGEDVFELPDKELYLIEEYLLDHCNGQGDYRVVFFYESYVIKICRPTNYNCEANDNELYCYNVGNEDLPLVPLMYQFTHKFFGLVLVYEIGTVCESIEDLLDKDYILKHLYRCGETYFIYLNETRVISDLQRACNYCWVEDMLCICDCSFIHDEDEIYGIKAGAFPVGHDDILELIMAERDNEQALRDCQAIDW